MALLLRLESLAILIAALTAYAVDGSSWWLFAILFLAPDLSFAAYLAGPRVGAIGYNALHSWIGPMALGVVALILKPDHALAVALIWIAHVAFDRTLGYGLKHASSFTSTHLGTIGRAHKHGGQ